MTTYPDNFGMNGNMNQNGLKPSQTISGYANVEQYKAQSTSQDAPTAQSQTRETPSMVPTATPSNFPKNMWRYGTKYEVKDDETFAFYEGYVVDYNVSEKKVHVVYEDDWKSPVWVDITYVRPCPESFDPQEWHPNDGDRIECMAKAEELEPSGWWGCQLVCEQHDHYLIAFDGWDDTHNEILEKDMLRPHGGDPPFDIDTPFITTVFQMDKPTSSRERDEFERKMREVKMHEEDLNDRIFQWAAKMPPQFEYIRKESKLLHLGYFPQRRNCLVMIGVTAAIQTATLALKYLLILQKRWILNDESQRERHQRTQEDIDKYEKAKKITVDFPPFLTNYLIGRSGQNISAIREDIGNELLELKVVDEGKCLIVAATTEAAERAREKVDMVVEYIPVPKSTVRDIIGPRGASIRELEEQSGVTFIQTEDRFFNWYGQDGVPPMPQRADNEVIMVVAGTRGDVETCSHLLRMKADHALRMEAARGRKQAAMQEWANLNGDKPRYSTYVDDDDDDYPEPGDARYGGGGGKRPGSARERRRGNRRYQRASTSAGGDGVDVGDGDGDDLGDVDGMDADMQRENDVPYDLDVDGDEDDGGYDNSFQRDREPRGFKYVVKGSSESKGQSEEVTNDQ